MARRVLIPAASAALPASTEGAADRVAAAHVVAFDLCRALSGARRRGWPLVMGILNVTPDSFSDGGRFLQVESAVEQGLRLVEQGADIIDVGGESTRPGAEPVSAALEMERVLPVISGLRACSGVPISIDTSKAVVMTAAVQGGASLINDVRALRGEGALSAAARASVPVVLMHMLGEPRSMQQDPRYDDVVTEVRDFLGDRVGSCMAAGMARGNLIVDPGIGFGKTFEHNLELLRNLARLAELDVPVLVGASRKSMLSRITGRGADERLAASVAVALFSASRGAALLRVHDVGATVDALRTQACLAGVATMDRDHRLERSRIR
jgi:dihydropteroate synthase